MVGVNRSKVKPWLHRSMDSRKSPLSYRRYNIDRTENSRSKSAPVAPTADKSQPMIETRKARRREIFGWCMFDFANQAYTLLIITVIFGDLYTRIIVGDAPDYRVGNLLWSLALCLSYLLVVLSAPLLGTVMDHARAKKRLLFASYVATVVTTALLYFVAPGWMWLGFFLIVLSNTAYAIGESFIASFLPFLGGPGEQGK